MPVFRSNPALNLGAFAVPSTYSAPPQLNALYLRDGQYDGMDRNDVANTFAAFQAQTVTNRLALFFHGGLVDKASGQQSAANEYLAYQDYAFPLFFIWESGFGEVLAHHLPLIFAETIFGRILSHATDSLRAKIAPPVASAQATGAPSLVITNEDIDAFMQAVQSDPIVQNEAVAIARSAQDLGTATTQNDIASSAVLSPRTLLSPEVVSSVRGAYLQANLSGGASAHDLAGFPLSIGGALQVAFSIAKALYPSFSIP